MVGNARSSVLWSAWALAGLLIAAVMARSREVMELRLIAAGCCGIALLVGVRWLWNGGSPAVWLFTTVLNVTGVLVAGLSFWAEG